jgi:hypothetical protein
MQAKKQNLSAIALATSVALGVLSMPMTAQAEVASTAAISSMYLWRGQDISGSAPVLAGDVKYTHATGLYAYGWLSSLGSYSTTAGNAYEADFGFGYAGKAGPVAYDVQYYKFWYPENANQSFADAGAEVVVALTYDPVTFTAYLDAKGDKTYKYFTLSGAIGSFGLKLGAATDDTKANEYKHFDLTYNATSRLSFTYSKRFAIDDANTSFSTLHNAPLLMASYSLPIDLK